MMHQHLPSSRRIQPILKLKFLRKYLHSIPISKNSKRKTYSHNLRHVSYGILVISMAAFLGILSYSFSVGTWFSQTEEAHASEDVSPQSDPLQPKATLSITNPGGDYGIDNDKAATLVTGNGMAYRSHNVTLDVNDITKYTLTLSYASGKDALRLEGASTYFANATGQTPSQMADNTWGFAWDNTDTAESNMTFYTVPQFGASATDLSTGLLASNDTYSETFTKKLTFGAKFGSNNDPGHYKTAVMLSLTASAKEVVTTLDDLQYMQDMTPAICASSIAGEHKSLQDRRDGNTYTVYKLEDGNCWMTENLKLTSQSLTDWKATHPDDDNNLKLTSKYSNVASNSTYTLPTTFTSASSWTSTNSSFNATLASANANYGVYYSWFAATAGTSTTTTAKYTEAPSSICPKGWRLPSGGIGDAASEDVKKKQYSYSYNKLLKDADISGYKGSIKIRNAPYNFFLAGSVFKGEISREEIYGQYWSSTAWNDSASAFYLNVGTNNVGADIYIGPSYGYSVRCVAARSDLDLITTMQEMTPQICKNTETGANRPLLDVRDGSTYVVQKLEDGNCWMLQNLKLTKEGIEAKGNSATLSSNNSNVASDSTFTMPTTITSLSSSTFSSNSSYKTAPEVYNGSNNTGATNASGWQQGYGAYYNWYAATAGAGNGSITSNGQEAGGAEGASICPKGWRLPTSNKSTSAEGYNHSFNHLIIDPTTNTQITSAKAWKAANYTNVALSLINASGAVFSDGFFPAAGRISGSSLLDYVGSLGYYWSSTASGNASAYYLYFGYGTIEPSYNNSERYIGMSVRCVAPAS